MDFSKEKVIHAYGFGGKIDDKVLVASTIDPCPSILFFNSAHVTVHSIQQYNAA
jgi:hypothetical protein